MSGPRARRDRRRFQVCVRWNGHESVGRACGEDRCVGRPGVSTTPGRVLKLGAGDVLGVFRDSGPQGWASGVRGDGGRRSGQEPFPT